MKITGITLKNFKRFTDLSISGIPAAAKLVLIIGPNGCGKSSVFDALLRWHRQSSGMGWNDDRLYYPKSQSDPFDFQRNVNVTTADGSRPGRESLYFRTAYRNEPDFTVNGIGRLEPPTERARFNRLIETDVSVGENYQRLVYETMSSVYDSSNDTKNVLQLRQELIGNVRASMRAVFGDLLLSNISDPLGIGAFFFEKGTEGSSYHYKNLSGGEKAAFDLLLDMHIKRKFFQDTVYCIDEIDTHLHTRVQGALLKELVSILPETSQLWVTTHSLGVLRAAYEMAAKTPGLVSLIDFEGVDPDVPAVLIPSNLGRVTWDKLMSIALDDLSARIAPRVVVVCEGSSVGNRRKDFDSEIYNRILGSRHADLIFVSGGASNQVAATGASIRGTLQNLMPDTVIKALCDRDSKSEPEIDEFVRNGGIVLPERNLESYLFADDVIEALVHREGKVALIPDALAIKADAVANSIARGNPSDDVKSAAGEIYTNLKRLLGLTMCGNSTDTFMRDTLAPLVGEGMKTYEEMKGAIIDRLPI